MNDRLTRQIEFLVEIEGLKQVLRQSHIVGGERRENSAEHSWHLAMFALILAGNDLDQHKIISMLLLHDIVEIDCGDSPIHEQRDADSIARAESVAAQRIFGLLPEQQAEELQMLWHEFEAATTAEAKFAKALDRFQPLLLNTLNGGGTWLENDVTEQQVYDRYAPAIKGGSPELWDYARKLVEEHFRYRRLAG